MRKTMWMLIVALTVACSGAAEGPDVVLDQSACAKCGMLVSDYGWSAAARMADGSEKAFDDPYCLLKFVRTSSEKPAQIWFHEHEGEAWLKAEQAAFVKQQKLRGPMGGTVLAFADRQSAAVAAGSSGENKVMSYGELVADKELTDAQ
jgi:nitrous oxide reductase accessory protein NosL